MKTLDDIVIRVGATNAGSEHSKKDLKAILGAAFAVIKEETEGGDGVRIHGFGTFSMRTRAERRGTNPSTGTAITIPASTSMAFKVSKSGK